MRLNVFSAVLATFISLLPDLLHAEKPGVSYAYKVDAGYAAGISLYPLAPAGRRPGVFMMIVEDLVECMAAMPDDGSWKALCRAAHESFGSTIRIPFVARAARGPLVQDAFIPAKHTGFPFLLSITLNSQNKILTVSASPDSNSAAFLRFDDARQAFEAARTTQTEQTELTAVKGPARLELGRVQVDGTRLVTLRFNYSSATNGEECLAMLRQTGNTGGWQHLCEKSDKDGEVTLKGGLVEIDGGGAYSGRIGDRDAGLIYQIVVSQARDGFAVVGLRKETERKFRGANAVENVIFDGEVSGTGEVVVVPPAKPLLAQNNWMIPQRELPEIGINLEMSLAQTGPNLSGKAVIWFDDDRSQISGYCPTSSAMLQICERVDKDGPLQISISLTQQNPYDPNSWTGVATPLDWGRGPYPVDVFQAGAIPDWGDQEAGATYIRFRLPDVPPGGEPVSWMKLVPLDRDIATLDAVTNSVQPPLPPAAHSSACDQLTAHMSSLGSAAKQQAAMQKLSDAGFWGGFLPTTDKECARALDVLSTSETEAETDTQGVLTGVSNGLAEIALDRNGRPMLRIPRGGKCVLNTPMCRLFRDNPGDYPMLEVADGPESMMGMFNAFGDLFLLRVRYFEEGKGGTIYVSRIETGSATSFGQLSGN